jgi:phosphohistidine swiveling domain-containing protein/glycerol-3-phosphate acyltransferase PlsY
MDQVLGALLIFTLVPLFGALPLSGWIVRGLTGKHLAQMGTGNVGVSAAFYHGGTFTGVCAVMAEAFKGVVAVLIARHFFGNDSIWPIFSLIFLVMGRYWGSQGAGTTNVAWGFLVYDPVVTGLIFLISLVGFTLFRLRDQGRVFVLVLMPVITALRHPSDGPRVLMVACLAGLVAWIYHKIPDDLELPAVQSAGDSRRLFRFFQGDRALKSLNSVLSPSSVGNKAATLSQLRAWGYPVPPGYVLSAGDDPAALIATVFPGIANPLDGVTHNQKVVARSSALGEDGLGASAAGQYVSVTGITSPAALEHAITVCLNAYNAPSAVRYRQEHNLPEGTMNVLVQPHIAGIYSGVAFSRDPLAHSGAAVIVEALAGEASQVVSGKVTPEHYQVIVGDLPSAAANHAASWQPPADMNLSVSRAKGSSASRVPTELIQQVAYLARHLESRFHGIPQDIEWTFDGKQLWLLQSRPITTLLPIWTRKIAAEVIPGVIRPLTWSINRPLTCGVWGDVFTIVLKDRAADIDFSQTATLHYSRAYFNATLLGDILRRMGLPPESLDFLTRGAKFSRPPLSVTLRNTPGLLRLLRLEMGLPRQFAQAERAVFAPALAQLSAQPLSTLSSEAIAQRIEEILDLLRQTTYYNILAPLGLALWQAVFKVDLATLNNSQSPEVMALEELKTMAMHMRFSFGEASPSLLPQLGLQSSLESAVHPPPTTSGSLFAALAEHPEGHRIFEQLDLFLGKYGYLSAVATDIAVPTWRESPQPVREMLAQYLFNPATNKTGDPVLSPPSESSPDRANPKSWRHRQVQARLDLKGRVAEIYNRLLAELRYCFVEIESRWLSTGQLEEQGDIFFLSWDDIRAQLISSFPETSAEQNGFALNQLRLKIALEKAHWQQAQSSSAETAGSNAQNQVPHLVYGTTPPTLVSTTNALKVVSSGTLQGIGASAGQIEGTIRVLEAMPESALDIDAQTILVVPYTDAGWSPLLARIGGLIAEVGGQLSHGAIIAREYGIPAVMDVSDATHRLTNGQRVRLDGQYGTIEIL